MTTMGRSTLVPTCVRRAAQLQTKCIHRAPCISWTARYRSVVHASCRRQAHFSTDQAYNVGSHSTAPSCRAGMDTPQCRVQCDARLREPHAIRHVAQRAQCRPWRAANAILGDLARRDDQRDDFAGDAVGTTRRQRHRIGHRRGQCAPTAWWPGVRIMRRRLGRSRRRDASCAAPPLASAMQGASGSWTGLFTGRNGDCPVAVAHHDIRSRSLLDTRAH